MRLRHGWCLFFLGLVVCQTGCSGLGTRVNRAAATAARDSWTWAPLTAAAAIAATDSDERISRWAKTENPLFGSQEAAASASDNYRVGAVNTGWAIFLASNKRGDGNWLREKSTDGAAIFGGVMATRNLTGYLKSATQRERPHGGPVHDSFPSAHASDAFAHATLGRYYADRLSFERPAQVGLQMGVSALAAATAWARVEAGVHYPTDVLVGAAVANFATRFFLEISDRRPGDWLIRPQTDGDGVTIQLEKRF